MLTVVHVPESYGNITTADCFPIIMINTHFTWILIVLAAYYMYWPVVYTLMYMYWRPFDALKTNFIDH